VADSPSDDFPLGPTPPGGSWYEPCRVCAVLEKENAWLRAQVEIYRDQIASLADPLVLARVRVSVPSAQSPERKQGPRRLVKDELDPIERQKIDEAERPAPGSIEASFTEGS
jgi:hypothetical protein